MIETKKILLSFPRKKIDKPIIYHLIKKHNLIVNIFRASITPDAVGYLVIELTGETEDLKNGFAFIRSMKIKINENIRGIHWDETKCTNCGNCLSHCPSKALYIKDPRTRKIEFDGSKCVQCRSCITNCPYGACSALF